MLLIWLNKQHPQAQDTDTKSLLF